MIFTVDIHLNSCVQSTQSLKSESPVIYTYVKERGQVMPVPTHDQYNATANKGSINGDNSRTKGLVEFEQAFTNKYVFENCPKESVDYYEKNLFKY